MSDTIFLNAKRGLSSSLKTTAVQNGTFQVTTDTKKLYFDIDDVRLPLGDVVLDNTETEIKAITGENALPKLYLSSDTNKLFFYDTTASAWKTINDNISHADTADKATSDASGNNIVDTYETKSDATSKQTELQTAINNINTTIGNINSFEIKVIDTINDAPENGSSNIIYFVPDASATDTNKYDEYIWVVDSKDDTTGETTGHYENIGTTEAELANYYTKKEIDSKVTTLESADTTLQNNIDTLSGTVSSNKTAQDTENTNIRSEFAAADKTLQGNIDTLGTTVTTNKTAADKTQTDLETLQTTVSTNKTAQETADKTLQDNIDAVKSDVDTINRFKKSVVDKLPTVDEADPYTLYFVPEGTDHYAEYMLIEVKEDDNTTTKKFEKINSISELSDYYTKTEVDAIKSSLESSISTNGTAISKNTTDIGNLTTTVSDNKTASDNADSALDKRVTALEKQSGIVDPDQGQTTIASRVKTLEDTVATNETDIEKKVSDLTDTVSSNKSTLEAADSDLSKRISTLETDIGTYPTAEGTKDITTRLAAIESTASDLASTVSTNETDIEKKVSDLTTTVANNKTAQETGDTNLSDRIDPIETALGSYPTTEGTKDITTRLADLESKTTTSSSDLSTKLSTLETTVSDNKTASDNADSALDKRVTTLETDDAATKKAIGSYPTTEGTKDITTRLTDIETAASNLSKTVSDNKTAADNADSALGTRIDNLTTTVGDNKTAQESADTELQNQITDLKTSIGNINNFEIKTLADGEELPETGTKYTLYFVPVADGQDTNGGKTKYTEYMWISTGTNADTGAEEGYYEEIGITEAELSEYYTKTEVDGLVSTLNTTISGNKTTSDNADSALSGRLDTVEKDIGSYPTADGTKDITTRLAALETADTTINTNISNLTTTVSNNKTAADNADSALSGRLDTVEKAIGSYPTAEGTKDITTRLTDLESKTTTSSSDLSTKLSTLETTVSDNKTASDNADKTLQDNIDAINNELDTHSFKYAGSTVEGGAATKVTETASTAAADREVLVAGADHDTVEYSDKLKANPSTGDVTSSGKVTAASVVVDSIVLGGATLTYDKDTDTLVVEFNGSTKTV